MEALLQRGADVRCLVRRSSHLTWLSKLPVEFVLGDCSDPVSLVDPVKGVDQVFHLAGVTKAAREKTYDEVNALGTENLIRACLTHNPHLRKFIYLSSQAAAGPCQNGGRKRESDLCEPVSPYGRSKRKGEELALAQAHKLPLIILRPSAVYGPREKDLYTYIRLLSKRVMPVFSTKDQRISLCYVLDVVQALLKASEKEATGGEIFFLSDGHDYRPEDVGQAFAQAMGVSPVRIPVPTWIIHGIATCSEVVSSLSGHPALINRGKVEEMLQQHWLCDITKARTALLFEPRVSLAEGARLTVDWYRKENWL